MENRGCRPILAAAGGFESLFALFLFAGVVKTTPAFSWLPVDLTVIALAASLVAALASLRRRNWQASPSSVRTLLAFAAFAGVVVLSLAWSPGREYAGRKALHVVIMCGWSVAGATLVVAGEAARLRRFFAAMVVLAALTSLQVVWLMLRNPLVASEEWGRSYLGFGRLFGVASLAVVAWMLWQPLRRRQLIGALVALLVLGTGLMVGGGRGPLLATTAALAVPLGIGVRLRSGRVFVDRKTAILVGVLLGLVLVVLAIGQAGVFLRTVQRLVVLFTEGDPQSFGRRLWYYQQFPAHWLEAPLAGHGIGSWPLLLGWGDVRAYPHNIVIELLVELGCVGFAMFGWLCVASCRGVRWKSGRSDGTGLVVLMLLVAAVTNALISGDLTDNRLLFAALGMAGGLPRGAGPAHG